MKAINFTVRTLALVALLSLFATSSFAQIKLRRAMDFDGDNKADLTIYRPSNNIWYIMKSAGGYIFQQFGLANYDYHTPGDYDGDGKGDIAVWRDTTGVWYRLNSSNNTFYAAQFGSSGDEPVARDFDGDGKTDIAVVRRTNGAMIWYVLKSSDGGFFGYQYGYATAQSVVLVVVILLITWLQRRTLRLDYGVKS